MANQINGEPKDYYSTVLSRGGPAYWRLTFQHSMVTDLQGYLIHPKIHASLQVSQRQDIRILDLATGNGIWALDVAEKLPNVQVIGTDISDQQFPGQYAILPNTKFEVRDAFDDVPEEYRGAFDLIHLRLTVVWITNQDKNKLVRNILSMLKPDGFIQWSENGDPGILNYQADGTIKPGWSRAWKRAAGFAGMTPGFEWIGTLPEVLRQHGFMEVETFFERPKTKAGLLAQKTATEWIWTELLESLSKAGVPGVEEQWRLAQQEEDEDIGKGEYRAYNWQTIIAQKSM